MVRVIEGDCEDRAEMGGERGGEREREEGRRETEKGRGVKCPNNSSSYYDKIQTGNCQGGQGTFIWKILLFFLSFPCSSVAIFKRSGL